MRLQRLLCALAFWVVAPLAMASTPVAPLSCEQPQCFIIANQARGWPAPPSTATDEIRFGVFRVGIPSGWRYAASAPDGGIVFAYADGERLGVWLETSEHFGLTEDQMESAGYSFTDVPRIIFTETPDTVPAENTAKRAIWAAAMEAKRVRLRGASNGVMYKNDLLTAYYANVSYADFSGEAMIASHRAHGSQLRILARNMDEAALARIIGSVRLKAE